MDIEDIDFDSLRVDLYVCPDNDRPIHHLPDGRQVRGGQSLTSLVQDIGGWTGVIKDPWGREHSISLEHLADEDPDRTYVEVAFRYYPRKRRFAGEAERALMDQAPVDYMRLHAVQDDDPEWAGGNRAAPGVTLREMRERLGSEEGFLTDWQGGRHHVSLRAWRHADPDRTRIVVETILASGAGE